MRKDFNRERAALALVRLLADSGVNCITGDGSRTDAQVVLLERTVRQFIDDKSFGVSQLCLSDDPEEIRAGWDILLTKWGYPTISMNFIPERLKTKIREEKAEGRVLIYLPRVWAAPAAPGWVIPTASRNDYIKEVLRKARPMELGGYEVTQPGGWMFVDAQKRVSYANHTEPELSCQLWKGGEGCLEGMTAEAYVVFVGFYEAVYGTLPDTDCRVRLVGSSLDGKSLTGCVRDGRIHFDVTTEPTASRSDLGTRVIKRYGIHRA